MKLPTLLALAASFLSTAQARDLQVNPTTGDDRTFPATPAKTIARAIALAQPGDTIHLTPAVYHETALFSKKNGEENRPITLDGHGSILDGCDPINAAEWEQISPGLFRKAHLLPTNSASLMGRWYFLWQGEMNHMGRTSKGPKADLKKPADLQPGEWTYEAEGDLFYLRLAPGQPLADAGIRYPARQNGVAFSSTNSHLVIRNLASTHVLNDGFNIHGRCRDTLFENVVAIECGDDGFSAHDDCQCEIHGLICAGNSTGFADIGGSHTHYRDVVIGDCLGTDVLLAGDGEHSLTHAAVFSSAATAFATSPTGGKGPQPLTFLVRETLFQRLGPTAELRLAAGSQLTTEACTFLNIPLKTSGSLTVKTTTWSDSATPPSPALTTTLQTLHQNLSQLRRQIKAGTTLQPHTPQELGLEEVLTAR